MTPDNCSKVFIRTIIKRLTSLEWLRIHTVPQELMDRNRCFNLDHLRRCVNAPTLALELMASDFANLSAQWQQNISGRTYHQWCDYEREQMLEPKPIKAQSTRCAKASPLTGQLCTMGEGHAGPHQVGGPYHTIETFITKCPEGACVYHANRSSIQSIIRWQECIKCGHRKPLQVDQYLLETPSGAVEILATDDREAVEFAKKHLEQSRVGTKGLKLFRYPKEWVNRPTAGLIEVPFFNL